MNGIEVTWKITVAEAKGKRIKKLLKQGWEPFAVAPLDYPTWSTEVVYLKKAVFS